MRFCARATDPEAPWHCPRWCSCTAVQHAADCWDLTVDEIHRRAPDLDCARAWTCPAGGASRATCSAVTIDDWVDSLRRRHRGRRARRRRHRRPFAGGAHRAGRGDEARRVAGAGDGFRGGFRPTGRHRGRRHAVRPGVGGMPVVAPGQARSANCPTLVGRASCSATGCPRQPRRSCWAACTRVAVHRHRSRFPPWHARATSRERGSSRCATARFGEVTAQKHRRRSGGVQTVIADGHLSRPDGQRAGTAGDDPRRALPAVRVAPTIGAALCRHSSHSGSGSESAVIPPPTPSTAEPSASNSTVRIATFSSQPASGEAKPTVPQYTPRRRGSQPVSSSRARAFGVPVTDAGGNVASSSAAIGRSTRHPRGHRRHQMPHARRGSHREQFGHGDRARHRDAAQVVADQVDDHDVLRDVLDRRPQRRGIRVRGRVPLIGLDVTSSPARRRNNSGDSDATAPQSPARYAARAGDGAFHRVDEEVDRGAVERACELRAHACLVDLARGDGLQTVQHARAVGVAIGRVPSRCRTRCGGSGFRNASAIHPESAAPERLSYHQCPSPSWRSTQSVQPPAASGMRPGRPSAPASG